MPEVLNGRVPEGGELIEGEAQLWKELRLPTPYVYFLGKGALLNEVEYTPEAGWRDRYDYMRGSRLTVGVITPIWEASYYRAEKSFTKI